jgi:hypothetical protein
MEDDERRYVDQFLSSFSIENFENLQCLRLNKIPLQTFRSLLSNLHRLHQLSKLVILDYSDDADQLIFEQLCSNRIPTLKSVTLDFILHYEPEKASFNYEYSSSSNMEVLTLHCYVDNVHYFLQRTPMLKKLTLTLHEFYRNDGQTTNVDKTLFLHMTSTLSYLKVNFAGGTDFYTMDTVTELFKVNSSSLSQLEHLVITGEVHETFLDGQR